MRDPDAYAAVLDSLDKAIGLDRLRWLHVNDSQAPFGSNRDRHANVGEGEIGEQLGVFLAHPAVQGLPAVLETAGRDGHHPGAEDVQDLRDLHSALDEKAQAESEADADGLANPAIPLSPRFVNNTPSSRAMSRVVMTPGAGRLPPSAMSLFRNSARVGHANAPTP